MTKREIKNIIDKLEYCFKSTKALEEKIKELNPEGSLDYQRYLSCYNSLNELQHQLWKLGHIADNYKPQKTGFGYTY